MEATKEGPFPVECDLEAALPELPSGFFYELTFEELPQITGGEVLSFNIIATPKPVPEPSSKIPGRYLLFMYETYYPSGGTGDLVGTYDNLEDARKAANEKGRYDYADVYDKLTGEELTLEWHSPRPPKGEYRYESK